MYKYCMFVVSVFSISCFLHDILVCCRCINGSTLLHTAAYFGSVPLVRSLLSHRVDVNLTDYKGATPLHRVRNVECMKVCIYFMYIYTYIYLFLFICKFSSMLILLSHL